MLFKIKKKKSPLISTKDIRNHPNAFISLLEKHYRNVSSDPSSSLLQLSAEIIVGKRGQLIKKEKNLRYRATLVHEAKCISPSPQERGNPFNSIDLITLEILAITTL